MKQRVLWLSIFSVCVLILWLLGWQWGLSKSDWAAWVQAIGSVGAILVAVWVVQYQHQQNIAHQKENERQALRGQLNVLRFVFLTVFSICESCARKVGKNHVVWEVEAKSLEEVRHMLLRIPVSDVPDAALIMRIHDVADSLLRLDIVVLQLMEERSESTTNAIKEIISATSVIAATGLTEASTILKMNSSKEELKKDIELLNHREHSEKTAIEVLEKWKKEG